jgi:hypothetical protein
VVHQHLEALPAVALPADHDSGVGGPVRFCFQRQLDVAERAVADEVAAVAGRSLAERGAAHAGDTVEIVLHHGGGLREPGVEQRVSEMLHAVAGLPEVGQVLSPYDRAGAVSGDGTIGYVTVLLDRSVDDIPTADTQRILDTAQKVEGDGLQVELGGDAAQQLAEGGTGAEAFTSDRREFGARRQAVIAANPELREREALKGLGLIASMIDALERRGVPDLTACVAAGLGALA